MTHPQRPAHAVFLVSMFSAAMSASEPSGIDDLRAALAMADLPGVCVMSFTERRVQVEEARGLATTDPRAKYTPGTIQPVASISKTLIGYLLADLASRGRVDLDVPIDRWIPWKVRHPAFLEAPVTLRQLATHTSSIVDRDAAYRLTYEPGDTPSMTMRDFVRGYTDSSGTRFDPGNFGDDAPGARYEYSNLAAALAAVVIEHATGEDFARYAERMVLKPAGMKDSSFHIDPTKAARRATLIDAAGKPLAPYVGITYADGGLRTTCRDLTRYAQAILRARAGQPSSLSKAAVDLMLAPQFNEAALPANFKRRNQGLFWQFNPREGVGHSGGDPGVSSHLYLDPAAARGYVLIANVSTEDSKRYAEGVRGVWRALRESDH